MMRATTLSAAVVAFPAATASRQDAVQGLVLLQQRATVEFENSWDVKAWFDKLRRKQSTDAATAEKPKPKVDETLVSKDANHACESWCGEESFTKVEAGVEVVKNITSWSMKCAWLHCNGCPPCATAATAPTIEKHDAILSQETATADNADNAPTVENNDASSSQEIAVAAVYTPTIEKPQTSLSQATAELEMESNFGYTVPVTEAGYQTIAALQDDRQMKQFIYRVAQSESRFIKEDAGELNGLVPYYSGTVSVQNLEALRNDLRKASWVQETEGRRAPLSEAGYRKIASMMSKPDMVAFARRVLDMSHKVATDQAAFVELVSHFNGESGRSYADLQNSLATASWTRDRVMPGQQQAEEIIAQEQAADTDHAKAKRGKGHHAQ